MIRNTQKIVLLALTLSAVLVACPPPPDDKATQTQYDTTPIIPATTKVADASTRASLENYDSKSGLMRFGNDDAVLKNLAVGDVLASEVSKNAPYGYLRKVSAIRRENGKVILETTQATLDEAISNGDIEASFDLKPEDLVSAKALSPGVTVGLAPQTKKDGLSTKAEASIGDGMNYRVVINESWVEVEGSTPGTTVSAKVALSGEAYFNASYGVKISVRGPRFIPPRLPKLEYIEGSANIEQRARIKVTGDASGKITAEKKIGEYRFAPKCVVIVVVPVCVVPTLFIKVGLSGELKFKFEYAAEQRATSTVGVRWDSDKGWIKLDGNPQLSVQTQDQIKFDTGLLAEAYTKGEAALLLYGAAGPILTAKASFELDAAFPRSPTWILRGKLKGEYGFVVDLPILGRLTESTDKLFELEKEFARSPNSPPKLELNANSNNATVQVGTETTLGPDCGAGFVLGFATFSDPEDGCNGVQITRTSNLEGDLGYKHSFKRGGDHRITIAVRDSQGETVSKGFKLTVVNTNPVITPQFPGRVIEGEEQVFAVTINDVNEPTTNLCPNVIWTVTAPDTASSTTGCSTKLMFPRLGTRTVSVRVTDSNGGVATTSTSVNVLVPPSNPYPRILKSGLYSRQTVNSGLGFSTCSAVSQPLGTGIDLEENRNKTACPALKLNPRLPRYVARVEVDNPNNEALQYEWRFEASTDNIEVITFSQSTGSDTFFEPGGGDNGNQITRPCTLKLRVIAPEASRNREAIVWTGTCTYRVGGIR